MPCRRQTSAVFAPASCSRRIAMICSSVNLDRFIVRSFQGPGLYLHMEEMAGVRSSPHDADPALLSDIAEDIGRAQSCLFYSLAFLHQTPGAVTDAVTAA